MDMLTKPSWPMSPILPWQNEEPSKNIQTSGCGTALMGGKATPFCMHACRHGCTTKDLGNSMISSPPFPTTLLHAQAMVAQQKRLDIAVVASQFTLAPP